MNKILEARLKKGISATKLCELAGLDNSYLCLVEKGLKKPSLLYMYKIANALGVDIKDLLEENKENKND